jgi:putative RecB family exonuclease
VPGADGVVEIPASLSPSRASDFQTCPLLFRFRTIDRLPQEPSAVAVRGTLVHAVLERLFDAPAAERTVEHAVRLLPGEWDALREREPEVDVVRADLTDEQWIEQAVPFVERYFTLEDPQRLEPTDREVLVEATAAGDARHTSDQALILRGYIDRLDVAPTGEVRVVDYKTGRAPSEAFERKALFQMRFYALALWRSRGIVPRQLKLLYLADGQALVDTPDEAALEATERKIVSLWAAIRTAIERRDFRPQPSRLCDWCDHRALCPEFGGTPPELPVLRIVPHPAAAADTAGSDPLPALS